MAHIRVVICKKLGFHLSEICKKLGFLFKLSYCCALPSALALTAALIVRILRAAAVSLWWKTPSDCSLDAFYAGLIAPF